MNTGGYGSRLRGNDDAETASHLAARGVPVALEVGDQRRADVAERLLARIDREIIAEHVERLLGDADGAAVAGGADHARAGQACDHAVEAGVHLARFDDLVADEAAFRAVAGQGPLVLDRLAGD